MGFNPTIMTGTLVVHGRYFGSQELRYVAPDQLREQIIQTLPANRITDISTTADTAHCIQL